MRHYTRKQPDWTIELRIDTSDEESGSILTISPKLESLTADLRRRYS